MNLPAAMGWKPIPPGACCLCGQRLVQSVADTSRVMSRAPVALRDPPVIHKERLEFPMLTLRFVL